MDTPTLVVARYVVPDAPAKIGMIDAVDTIASQSYGPDPLYHVADDIVVVARVVSIIDSGAAFIGAAARGNVVNIVADDSHVRAHVEDAVRAIPSHVKSRDV